MIAWSDYHYTPHDPSRWILVGSRWSYSTFAGLFYEDTWSDNRQSDVGALARAIVFSDYHQYSRESGFNQLSICGSWEYDNYSWGGNSPSWRGVFTCANNLEDQNPQLVRGHTLGASAIRMTSCVALVLPPHYHPPYDYIEDYYGVCDCWDAGSDGGIFAWENTSNTAASWYGAQHGAPVLGLACIMYSKSPNRPQLVAVKL